jgi:uncharacterized membrane protein
MISKKRPLMISGVLLIMLGLSGIIASIVLGQVRIYLVLIIPVFVMKGPLPLISVLLIITGSIILFFSRIGPSIDQRGSSGPTSIISDKTFDGGGVIFIGPIPIIFGTKKFKEGLPKTYYFWILGVAIFIIIMAMILIMSFILWIN